MICTYCIQDHDRALSTCSFLRCFVDASPPSNVAIPPHTLAPCPFGRSALEQIALREAISRAVSPWPSLAARFAFISSSQTTTLRWPLTTAQWRGVRPHSSTQVSIDPLRFTMDLSSGSATFPETPNASNTCGGNEGCLG